MDKVTLGISIGKLAGNFSESILKCGELLERDFPRADYDINELDDNIVQLDK